MIDWLIDWLIEWLIDWLTGWLIDWLGYWLMISLCNHALNVGPSWPSLPLLIHRNFRVFAESKFSLDTMSLSTTSTSTPKLSDDNSGKSPTESAPPPLSAGVLSSAIRSVQQEQYGVKDTTRADGQGIFTTTAATAAYSSYYMTTASDHLIKQGNGHSSASPEPVSVMAQLAEEMRMQIELSDGFAGFAETRPVSPPCQLDQYTLAVLRQWIERKCAAARELADEVRVSVSTVNATQIPEDWLLT